MDVKEKPQLPPTCARTRGQTWNLKPGCVLTGAEAVPFGVWDAVPAAPHWPGPNNMLLKISRLKTLRLKTFKYFLKVASKLLRIKLVKNTKINPHHHQCAPGHTQPTPGPVQLGAGSWTHSPQQGQSSGEARERRVATKQTVGPWQRW